MYLKIGSLSVINANALACPYTAGFSLASFFGFVEKISSELEEEVVSFSVIVNQVEHKLSETIARDSAYTSVSSKGKVSLASLLPIKYFHFNCDLVLEFENDSINKKNLENIITCSKLQGGTIIGFEVSEGYKSIEAVLNYSKPLSKIISDVYHEIKDDENLSKAISEKLKDREYALMCNGYVKIKELAFKRNVEEKFLSEGEDGIDSILVEPNLTLVKYITVYDFLKESNLYKISFKKSEKNSKSILVLSSK